VKVVEPIATIVMTPVVLLIVATDVSLEVYVTAPALLDVLLNVGALDP
jgi:hypothetical protein